MSHFEISSLQKAFVGSEHFWNACEIVSEDCKKLLIKAIKLFSASKKISEFRKLLQLLHVCYSFTG